MYKLYLLLLCLAPAKKPSPEKPAPAKNPAPQKPTPHYHLVWSDEFTHDGPPDPTNWTFEHGFVRNHEQQWYTPENAYCKNGLLIIEAKKEHRPNPDYQPDSADERKNSTEQHNSTDQLKNSPDQPKKSTDQHNSPDQHTTTDQLKTTSQLNTSTDQRKSTTDWRKSRPSIDYTSACLETRGLHSWKTGRFEMRGRIDIDPGCWPAWWTLGIDKPWPANGEIDIMEYYRGNLLANIACLGANHKARWYSHKEPVDKQWAKKFHTWRMDWTEDSIHLYVDDTLLNSTPLSALTNQDGSNFQPFAQPHFMLLNLAIGGDNGGDPSQTTFPRRFEVDYVRVYQAE